MRATARAHSRSRTRTDGAESPRLSRGLRCLANDPMTQTEAQPQPIDSTAPVERNTERDLQRSALRDLVALSTECAARENDIEQALERATTSANRAYEQAVEQIELRTEGARQ